MNYRPIDVHCPSSGAGPGDDCLRYGKPRSDYHKRRYDEALIANEQASQKQ